MMCWKTCLVPFVSLLILLTSCNQENSYHPLRLAGMEYLGDLPTLIADEKGYFSAKGLEVEVIYGESGKSNLRKLKRGEVDFALMAPTPFLIEKLEAELLETESDTVILSNLLHTTSLSHIVTLRARNLTKVEHLRGKKIGLPEGTNAEYQWWLYCYLNGVEDDLVEIVDIPPNQIDEALKNQTIDAAVTWQPWTAKIEAQMGEQIAFMTGKELYVGKWLLVTTKQTLNQHPNETRLLIDAYIDAVEYVNTQPIIAVNTFAKKHGHDYLLENITEFDVGLAEVSLDWSLIAEFNQIFEWLRDKYEGQFIEISPLTWIDSDALSEINPIAVGIPKPVRSSHESAENL